MIQVKENDLQSMNRYKENEEGMQSMWLSFQMIVNQLFFQICSNVSLIINITQYTIEFLDLKMDMKMNEKKNPLNPSTFN